MANFLHRTTKAYSVSVSPNGLPEPIANYIENPDVSAVAGNPTKYWKITGDIVTLMNAAEMQAVDDAIAAQLVTDNRADAVNDPDDVADVIGWRNRALIELLNKRDNFNTNRIIELQNRVQAMLDSTGAVGNMRTDGLAVSISATNTRSRADAIQDYKDDINAGGADS